MVTGADVGGANVGDRDELEVPDVAASPVELDDWGGCTGATSGFAVLAA